MIVCPKCNRQLEDGTKFCDSCGAQIVETIFCPNCGKQTSTEFAFCQNCGASITEKSAEDQPATSPAKKKKLPKKAILIGGIGVVVIAVLITAFSLLFRSGGKSEENYALYLKDKEIFFTDLKKDSAAWQLTSRLIDGGSISNEELAEAGSILGLYTYMSDNGKYLFFPDKIGDHDGGFSLYYKEVDNPDADAVKIDSGVQAYSVNTDATIVTYLKGEEGGLYQYKIAEDVKDKITSDVKNFAVSDKGDKIVYINSEHSIYLKNADKEKEKIASDVSSLEYVSEDLTTVYYIKEDALYKQVDGEDKVKIASDVYDVIKIYESGEIYYSTSETETISLMSYVTDDMKDADASITEPTYPNYPNSPSSPSWWDYDTYEEYEAAYAAYEAAYEEWEETCDRLETEYYEVRDAYLAKLSRDEMRDRLEEATLENTSYSLYFFDGAEKKLISNSFIGGYYYYNDTYYYSDYTVASDAPVIIYAAFNQSDIGKVKFSEIESIYEIEVLVKAALFSSNERYIAVKSTDTIIEQEKEAREFRINDSGTVVYYIDDIPDEKGNGELYCISISDDTAGKPEVYDNDVYTGYCYFVSDSEFVYFKDYKDGKGELYINKNRIDFDVKAGSVKFYAKLSKVVYFIDWNSEKEYGTLKVYDGKESVKIADDVHNCSATLDGRILYLCDYSLNYYKGDLYEWAKGETRKLDDDVACVLPILDGRYRGLAYGW